MTAAALRTRAPSCPHAPPGKVQVAGAPRLSRSSVYGTDAGSSASRPAPDDLGEVKHKPEPVHGVEDMPECFSRPICKLAMQLNDHASEAERQRLLPFVTVWRHAGGICEGCEKPVLAGYVAAALGRKRTT